MDQFKALRRLAVTLGVAAPESSDDLFNSSFINSLNRAAKRAQRKGVTNLDESRWINITVEQPKDGETVNYCGGDVKKGTTASGEYNHTYGLDSFAYLDDCEDLQLLGATHWQPLPRAYEEIFHHIDRGNGGLVTKPSEVEVLKEAARLYSINEDNSRVMEYLRSHGMGFLRQQIGRGIRPRKVKGYIFQLKDGSYYRCMFSGTTERRCDAHVYSMAAILTNMADHDVDSWGVTWKGKWKVVYNKGNEV